MLTTRDEVVGWWREIYTPRDGGLGVTGLYGVTGTRHPMQDPSIPFIYDPGSDSYIGFLWHYEEDQPLPDEPTYDSLSRNKQCYLNSAPEDVYRVNISWPSRLIAVNFRVNNILRLHGQGMASFISGLKIARNFSKGLRGDEESRLRLAPIIEAGYDSLLFNPLITVQNDLLLTNPSTQIIKTQWWTWR